MPASVKDVAARAGVSSSTVSNYLNHPHLLGEAAKERVRSAIAELGYVPNESARQLRAGTGKLLAVSLIDAWQPYFAELSRGVEDVIRDTPWSLMFSNSNRDAQQERDNLDMFEAHRVQGLIIYPQGEVGARLERLADRGPGLAHALTSILAGLRRQRADLPVRQRQRRPVAGVLRAHLLELLEVGGGGDRGERGIAHREHLLLLQGCHLDGVVGAVRAGHGCLSSWGRPGEGRGSSLGSAVGARRTSSADAVTRAGRAAASRPRSGRPRRARRGSSARRRGPAPAR